MTSRSGSLFREVLAGDDAVETTGLGVDVTGVVCDLMLLLLPEEEVVRDDGV